MNEIEVTELLRNKDVINEIHRHLWLESEKVGYDIGLAWAAEDWMNRYAQSWLDYNMPGKKIVTPSKKARSRSSRLSALDGTPARIKRRRAKSYLDY